MLNHETFCATCASLSWEQITSEVGQDYHANWRTLETSAAQGCRLCRWFLDAQRYDKARSKTISHGADNLIRLSAYDDRLNLSTFHDGTIGRYIATLPAGTVPPSQFADFTSDGLYQVYLGMHLEIVSKEGIEYKIAQLRLVLT